ncbi:hypothetical protein DL89DRAFT_257445 [Linderina pennispora]|uniref:Uncharacterized protein n=1 Tax=Linderina pennispora TaxID=61395 RepID=A0A1Y1WAK0_9FUNG|nr:uncharacterized protein DL89DRAFT_257445 [Linderina pennispora]ORX70174.1 hypothetical protein DL89DRAFT_257445 [Linderina pennispora]
MDSSQTDVSKLLDVLKGQMPGQKVSAEAMAAQKQARDSTGMDVDEQASAAIWQVPANVGSDLTKPFVLGSILPMWDTLDETQKLNILLGIAHVGVGKMHAAQAEARRVSALAKSDASSDWVRTLGSTIGDVGVTGRLNDLETLGDPVQAEIEKSVAQMADSLEAQQLALSTEALSYVSPQVAAEMAPEHIRYMYGVPPTEEEVARITETASRLKITIKKPVSRRPSALPTLSRRESSADAMSPAASNPELADFSDLFGDEPEQDRPAGAPARYLTVKTSHQADHAGRLARLLAAADEADGSALHGDKARRPSGPAGRPAGVGVRPTPGSPAGRPTGAGVRPTPGGHAGARPANKLGILAPRRRAAPSNTALPASGLDSARRGAGTGTPGYQAPKRIQMVTVDESTTMMQARDTTLKERRERLAEEREAKRRQREEEREEKRRLREEKRQAAAEARAHQPKRPRRNSSASRDAEPHASHESGEASASDDSAGEPPAAQPDYRMFAGNDDQVRAVYAETNALTDENRLIMFNFFNNLPPPPGVVGEMDIVLNQKEIPDAQHPGKVCQELMVLQADISKGEWRKLRRIRRL